ncbi:MAG: right-handed parallel beta-helix repeat-containing protein [Deltaproteobacteria bacterium]|jgi:parallel beta-helix repeat protein|nr:right-handed parallel beta-helix repeat-containing protein [Deltaproteobacteria bacterium]
MTSQLQFIIALAALFMLLPCPCLADSPPLEYAGSYNEHLVWADQVVMVADVLIRSGGSLTIRPGTTVYVVPAEGTQIDPEYLSSQTELLVRGRITIQGTPQLPVRFVVQDRPGLETYAWAGIILDHASDLSDIAYTHIDRAEVAIRCVSSSPTILGNIITHCRYGMIIQKRSHPKVLENNISHGEAGVFCWLGSKPTLRSNRLERLDEEGLFIDASSQPLLDQNVIRYNEIGLASYNNQLPAGTNLLQNNRVNARVLGHQGLPSQSP